MRFGVYVPTLGEYDVRALAALAREAEAAGWDGVFVWDHLLWVPDGVATRDLADTTVALAAIALATERIRFGALVTPLARRRPWKLARETATLDRLSGGRLVVGVGLGGRADVDPVGEGRPERERAALLDESLEVLAALWSGEPVTHRGERLRLDGARVRPAPLQRPRIPVWVGGSWPSRPPFRRAARWDGAVPLSRGSLLGAPSPDELRDCRRLIEAHREGRGPFDLVVVAEGGGRPGLVPDYERAGATWWLDAVNPRLEGVDSFRARVREGPPGPPAASAAAIAR